MIGCAAPAAHRVETTPAVRAERMARLRSAVMHEVMTDSLRGAYLPKQTAGSAIVCSMAIAIDAWYGFGDEKWELTKADVEPVGDNRMTTVRASSNMREEFARIGIRDCVLDVNR